MWVRSFSVTLVLFRFRTCRLAGRLRIIQINPDSVTPVQSRFRETRPCISWINQNTIMPIVISWFKIRFWLSWAKYLYTLFIYYVIFFNLPFTVSRHLSVSCGHPLRLRCLSFFKPEILTVLSGKKLLTYAY